MHKGLGEVYLTQIGGGKRVIFQGIDVRGRSEGLFFEISELKSIVAGHPRELSRGGRFHVLSAPVLSVASFPMPF